LLFFTDQQALKQPRLPFLQFFFSLALYPQTLANTGTAYPRLKDYQKELEGLNKKDRKEREKEIFQSETDKTRKLREKIGKRDFKSVKLIGRGAFGEVRALGILRHPTRKSVTHHLFLSFAPLHSPGRSGSSKKLTLENTTP
jgi:hypothetical protein